MAFVRTVLVTVLVSLLPGYADAFRNVSVGSNPPALSVESDGKRATIPAPGRATVVLFWRPGQAFSEDALADLTALAPALAAKGVAVVAVAETGADAAKARRLPFDAVVDAQRQVADAFGVIVFPSTAVIDQRGVLRAYLASRRPTYRGLLETHVAGALGELSDADLAARFAALGEVYGQSAEAAQAAYKRGTTAAAAQQWDAAAQEFANAIALQPGLGDAHLQLGYARLEQGEFRQALDEFRFVLGKNPTSPGARVGVGIARVRLGQVKEGIQQLEDAVVLNPEPVRGHYELGRAYETVGDVDRAVYHYRWALLKLLQGRK